MKKTVVVSKADGYWEADIVPIADWDGFDSLAQYLVQVQHARVLEQLDGPDSRVWKFELKGAKLAMHNNPYGNTLRAYDDTGKAILSEIAQDLTKRLRDDTLAGDE